jgi:hypothetical protein
MKLALSRANESDRRRVGLPLVVLKTFARRKAFFVLHFGAGTNPVAHVNERQPLSLWPVELPKHAVSAVTGVLLRGIKGVNRRQALIQDVDNTHHFQFTHLASCAGFSEFNQPRIDSTLKQKLLVLLYAVLVHAATRMAAVLIAQIQVVVFTFKTQI